MQQKNHILKNKQAYEISIFVKIAIKYHTSVKSYSDNLKITNPQVASNSEL